MILDKYLNRYGKDIANHVIEMINTVDGSTSSHFFDDFYFFYNLFPKINFYNRKKILIWFMEEFNENQIEYKRIYKMFEYISNSLCGFRKNLLDVDLNVKKFCYDLQGFDRTGEYCEI